MRRRAAALLAVLAVACTAAGCASKTKEANRYVDAANAVERRFAIDIDSLNAATGTPGRAALEQYAATAQRLANGLKAIDPPAEVRTEHAQLVAAADDFRTRLARATAEITSRRSAKVVEGQLELSDAVSTVLQRIDSLSGAINRALHD